MSCLSISDIRSINEHTFTSHDQVTAVFVGATNGIGLGILRAFTKHVKKPRAIVLGRSREAFESIIKELERTNSSLDLTFIESDVSRLKNVDNVSAQIKELVPAINLLFMSPGFINFGSYDANEDGFDKCQGLRYHTRLRFAYNLLPLMKAPFARVVSILAAGSEGDLDYDDLELRKPGNYSLTRAGAHAPSMITFSFEKLAKENPQVGFIHAHPGWVRTNVLANSAGTGILGFLARWLIQPLMMLFSISIEESGERFLCYATSDKVAGPAVEGQESLRLSKPLLNGSWTLDWDGKAASNDKTIAKLRSEDAERRIWEHTAAEWKRVLG